MAGEFAAAAGASLTIMAVRQVISSLEVREFARIEHTIFGEIAELETPAILAQAKADTAGLGIREVSTALGDGDVARAILKMAEDISAVLIVVGKRGQSRLEGLLLGSVSQKLVSLADRPVTVVP